MPLPNDYSRCEGERLKICPRREMCQRYQDRGTGATRTPYHPHLCESEAYQFYIPVIEVKDDSQRR
jgi:hypothetical protein